MLLGLLVHVDQTHTIASPGLLFEVVIYGLILLVLWSDDARIARVRSLAIRYGVALGVSVCLAYVAMFWGDYPDLGWCWCWW